MNEPEMTADDRALADYYEEHHDSDEWAEAEPVSKSERLDVTLSVRFTSTEIEHIRAQAAVAGLKPTTYIRQCALADEAPPIDRARLARSVDALSREVEDLRRAAG